MAYVDNYELSWSTTGAASFAVTMPVHQSGDLLVCFVAEDGTGTLSMTGWDPSDFSLLVGVGSSHASRFFTKRATSSSETGTITMGTAYAISVITLCIKDADTEALATTATSGNGSLATISFADQGYVKWPVGSRITITGVTPTGYNGSYPVTGTATSSSVQISNTTTGSQTVAGTITGHLDSVVTSAAAAATQFSSPSLTPTFTNDTLLLYLIARNGIASQSHSDPGPAMFLISSDSTGTTATTSVGTAAAWYMQRTAGNTPTPSWTSNTSEAYNAYTIAIRNKTNGRIPAYIDDISSPGTLLAGMHHSTAGATVNGITFSATVPYANAGPAGTGLTVTYDAVGSTADYGINPYSAAASHTPPAAAAGTSYGFPITFSASKNFTTGFIMGSFIAANPKNANFNHGSVKQGGTWISFGDTNNYYRSYQILARDSKPNTEGRAVFSIQPTTTSTRYGYSTNNLNTAAVTNMMILSNCPTATITEYLSEFHQVFTQVIAGGDANYPIGTADVADVGRSFRLPVIQQVGSAGLLSYAPIQIGGGDPVNFQIDAGSLQFPRRSSTTEKEINFHAEDNHIGISYAGKTSADVIKHTNSIISSPSQYYWEIHPNATTSGTWDFNGLSIINASATLRPVTIFNNMSFSACPSITASGCDIDFCSIDNVPTTNNTFNVSTTTTVNDCTIDTSTLTTSGYWCSTSNPEIFQDNTFSGGTGHALRFTASGVYDFIGNTFTGYGANSTGNAAIFNDCGGALTLNISGGGSTPTYRNGSGASTIINNNVNITLTDLINPTEVRVYITATTTEVAGQENVTTGSFQFSYGAGETVDIRIFAVGYLPADIMSFTIPASDTTLPIQQIFDRVYSNP